MREEKVTAVLTSKRIWGVLVASALILTCLMSRDYGISWDEPIHSAYGHRVLSYYATGFEDKTATTEGKWIFLYGALFDSTAALLNRISPFGLYETRHLLNAIVGVLGIIGVWKLAKMISGPEAAFLAAFLLAFTPSYLGHMFNNPKDIPFAVGYVWSLYYIIRCFSVFPKFPMNLAVKLGLVVGMTLGVRVGGLILWAYFCVAAVAYLVFPAWFSDTPVRSVPAAKGLGNMAAKAAIAFVISYIIMLICWPWAQADPLFGPLKSLAVMADYPSGGKVLLAGEYVYSGDLPWQYLPQYFLVKMPESILISLGLGLFLSGRFLFSGQAKQQRLFTIQMAFLAFATMFPVFFVILTKGTLYDGLRHFLFIVPCLCVFCGVSVASLWKSMVRRGRSARFLAVLLIAMLFLPQAVAAVRLHPYQYIYYNCLAGGTTGADGRYIMDYWVHSFKEATAILADYLKTSEGDAFKKTQYRILVNGPNLSAEYFFPDNFIRVDDIGLADFVISMTRWHRHMKYPGVPIAAVRRMGVELSIIQDCR